MRVGDAVVTPSGSVEYITGVFPQGDVQLYKVEFQDGRSVETCGAHLWKFHRSGEGKVKARVGTTLDMEGFVEAKRHHSKGSPIIPLVAPLNEGRPDFNIAPYTLGCLLGDGYLAEGRTPNVTSADMFIIEEMCREGTDVGSVTRTEGNKSSGYSVVGIRQHLRDLGLFGVDSFTKFIPELYKKASVKDKFSVIQGLFDTDGYVSPDGKTYFYSVSKTLAKDVAEVLFSLGFSVTTTVKHGSYKKNGIKVDCADCYCLYVRGANQNRLFRLPRKVERTRNKDVGLKVVSVTKTRIGPATCISITGEEKLFVTTNYIVTHNTRVCLTKYLNYLSDPNFRGIVFRQSRPFSWGLC